MHADLPSASGSIGSVSVEWSELDIDGLDSDPRSTDGVLLQ
jgi:hypothetical protein